MEGHLLPTSLFRDFEPQDASVRADIDILRLRQFDSELVRVDTRQLNDLLGRSLERTDVDGLMQKAADWFRRPERFQLWMMCSPTLGDAARKFARISGQQGDNGFVAIGGGRIDIDLDRHLQNRRALGFSLCYLALALSQILDDADAITIFVRPGFEALGQRLEAAGYHVLAGREENRISLSGKAIAASPLRTANPALEQLLALPASLPGLPSSDDVAGLSALLVRENMADPDFSLTDLAGLLCMSARSLQRRLAAQGLSFSALRDRERYSLLREMRVHGLPRDQMAMQLGYSDTTGLYKFVTRLGPAD